MTVMQRRRFRMQFVIGLGSAPLSLLISWFTGIQAYGLMHFATACFCFWMYETWYGAKLTSALEIARREHERQRETIFARAMKVADEGRQLMAMGRQFEEGRAAALAKTKALLDQIEASSQALAEKDKKFFEAQERAALELDRTAQLLREVRGSFELPALDAPKKPGSN